MSDLVFLNGIDATTGKENIKPLPPEQLSEAVQREPVDEQSLRELKWWYERSTVDHYGVKEGIDPKNLAEAGWGVIFAHDSDPAVREALSELLDFRRQQASQSNELRYKEYNGNSGYRPGETKMDFLARQSGGPGPVDPDKVPYYLLLVGSPKTIPYAFQTSLDLQYAVGRLDFDTPEEYLQYARSVVAAEKQGLNLPACATFFGAHNPDDPFTALTSQELVLPLAESLAKDNPAWQVEKIVGSEATRERLRGLVGGPNTPAFLFAAAHGVSFPRDHPQAPAANGALLCANWPGPRQWEQPLPPDFYFSADDLAVDARLWGLIAFFYASMAAGTPVANEIEPLLSQGPATPGQAPFTARLAQRMLAHPNGSALAVVAPVGQAWGYSFPWEKSDRERDVFESILRQLVNGHPVGSAFEYMNQRYAELSSELSNQLEEISFGMQPNAQDLYNLWATNNDARNFTILGDPAVRLPVVAGQKLSRIRVIELASQPAISTPRASDSLPALPEFITQLRSTNLQDQLEGARQAVRIVKQKTDISEQLLQVKTQMLEVEDQGADSQQQTLEAKYQDLEAEEQKLERSVSLLRNEIPRLVLALRSEWPEARENARLVLEILGPIARTEAVPALKELILNASDEAFRPHLVSTIVAVDNRREDLTEELRSFLKDGLPAVRQEVLKAISGLKEPLSPEMTADLWGLASDEQLGGEALETIYHKTNNPYDFLLTILDRIDRGDLSHSATRCRVAGLFLQEKNSLDEAWLESWENKARIFQLLLASLTDGAVETRLEAVDWLLQRVDDIPGDQIDEMIKDLKLLSHRDEDWVEQSQLDALLRNLVKRKRAERNLLLEDLRGGDSVAQIEAIKRAAESRDEWALRILIGEWVNWIAFGQTDKTQLVEEVAEKLRTNPLAVLPLVNQISQEFQPSRADLERNSPTAPKLVPPGGAETGDGQPSANGSANPLAPAPQARSLRPLEDQIDSVLDGINARDWNIRRKVLRQLDANPKFRGWDDDGQRKYIQSLLNEELKACELKVHRRVARQLADMSNPYFFHESQRNADYKEIQDSLEKYAVPVLARILPETADDEIRKDLAFALGNIGGREAVDALARAVVGEERTRANRQKLLAQYYLEPSKQRSDEAAGILKDAIRDAKRTLWFQQGLNIAVFVVGMVILASGVMVSMQGQDAATRVAGALVGLGGLAGVITQLINSPLDRIQNAMANLVQIETAFTSFIWELNLNGTYIQSQYVAEGILDGDDIGSTIQRIEDAMNLTLDQVAAYTHLGRQVPVAHLLRLSPVVGGPDTTIQIFGHSLRPNSNPEGDKAPHIAVAVNHVPVKTGDLGRKKDQVRFDLPAGSQPGILWISLVIDGQETNALPFHLLAS